VTDGMDVIERIGNVPTGKHGQLDETPIKPVVILKVERVGGAGGGAAKP
jgi:cyclophilin family peptidyl-prolyl cis-trans isomerase